MYLNNLFLVFRDGEVFHLLGSFFRHRLGVFFWTGGRTGDRTGIRSVRRAVGILPVAEDDAADSDVGGADFDLQPKAAHPPKQRKRQKL